MLAERRSNGLLAVVFCCSILAACSSDSPSGCSAQSSVFRVSPGGFAECRPGLTPAEDGQRSIAAAAVSPLPSRAGGVARVALPAILNHCPAPSPGKFASWLAAADGLLLEYGPWSASGVLGKVPAKFMHEREAAVPGSTIVRGTGDDWQQSHAAAGCGGRKHRYVSHMVARPSEDLWRVSSHRRSSRYTQHLQVLLDECILEIGIGCTGCSVAIRRCMGSTVCYRFAGYRVSRARGRWRYRAHPGCPIGYFVHVGHILHSGAIWK